MPRFLLNKLQPETPISEPPISDSQELHSTGAAGDGAAGIEGDAADVAARTEPALARKDVSIAVLRGILCAALFSLSLVQVLLMFLPEERLPGWALQGLEYSSVVHAANRYGLFAVMTKERPEIVVEGTLDGVNWVPYHFQYKPVDVDQRPRFNAPHQPRLDWQMWFAALRSHRRGGWFDGLCIRLLQGSPDVLWLLAEDPFQGRKPKQVRATLYQYEFTTLHERRQTGAYYKRHDPQPYLGPVSLPDK